MLAYCFGKRTDSTESIDEFLEGDLLYKNNKLGRIEEGILFFITGKTIRNGDRFLIDFSLENSNKDIALRVAPRISTNIVGRNARIKNVWGTEETNAAIRFRLRNDARFQIQILFTIEAIMIAFNSLHIAKFIHRLPFHNIRSIEIRGDITNVHVERKIVTGYPLRSKSTPHIARLDYTDNNLNAYSSESDTESMVYVEEGERFLPLPYYATFAKGFFDLGYSIGVTGYVRLNPHSFKLSLQVGQNIWPQPTIALLMEFRFKRRSDGESGEPVMVRNSFANGKWTDEVKSELSTGLRPGVYFHIVIRRGKKSFEIYMNDKPVTDYPYKVNPKFVDTVFLAGDIKLFDVEIESD